MKFWQKLLKKKVEKSYHLPPSPSPSSLVVPDSNTFFNEDVALSYIQTKYGEVFDLDTGIGLVSGIHWSYAYPKIARLVKVKTTTGWLDDSHYKLVAEGWGGASVGITGTGNLRFFANIGLRKDILDETVQIKTDDLFRRLILKQLEDVVLELHPSTIGVITSAMIIQCQGLNYWNPYFETDRPCEHLLLHGYYDFIYGEDLNERP